MSATSVNLPFPSPRHSRALGWNGLVSKGGRLNNMNDTTANENKIFSFLPVYDAKKDNDQVLGEKGFSSARVSCISEYNDISISNKQSLSGVVFDDKRPQTDKPTQKRFSLVNSFSESWLNTEKKNHLRFKPFRVPNLKKLPLLSNKKMEDILNKVPWTPKLDEILKSRSSKSDDGQSKKSFDIKTNVSRETLNSHSCKYRSHFADNLLSTLHLNNSSEAKSYEVDLDAKVKKYKVLEFSKRFIKTEKFIPSSVVDLETQFYEFRRALELIPCLTSEELDVEDSALVGEGANGKVYTVKDFKGKKYAVKKFHPITNDTASNDFNLAYKQFMREAVISSVISHINIAITYDICYSQSHFFLVMEHYPINLCRLVTSGKAQSDQLNDYYRQIVSAINYLHDNGIAHRDIKMENMCLSKSGIIKIVDFGGAVLFTPPGPAICTDIAGTDQYISPEILSGYHYDARCCDVWSLGILYLAMLLRRLPWPLPCSHQKNYADFLKNPLVYLTRFRGWESNFLPPSIVVRMLEPNPDLRITINELLNIPWYNEDTRF